jgi:hypothetical protein
LFGEDPADPGDHFGAEEFDVAHPCLVGDPAGGVDEIEPVGIQQRDGLGEAFGDGIRRSDIERTLRDLGEELVVGGDAPAADPVPRVEKSWNTRTGSWVLSTVTAVPSLIVEVRPATAARNTDGAVFIWSSR